MPRHMTSRTAAAAIVAAVLTIAGTAAARADSKPQVVVDNARYTLEKMVGHPDFKPLPGLLRKAQAVLIVPSLLKAGFFVGGEGGAGVLLARGEGGEWSNPAFFSIGAGSFGLQIGFQDSQVMLLVMSRRTLESMLEAKVKLGADASVSAGPVGIGFEGGTAINLRADIYSYALSRGAFLGASFEGSVTLEDKDRNKAYYGPDATVQSILIKQQHSNPGAAELLRVLNAY